MILTSIFPFLLMILLFVTTGYVLSWVLPTYRIVVPEVLAKKSFSTELEGMRGILAFSVVIHHAVVWYLLLYYHTAEITGPNSNLYSQLGVAPVTLFFFITGFLFWSKIRSNPKLPFKFFMSARLRRLGPAYLGAAGFMFFVVAILTHLQLRTSVAGLARDSFLVLLAQTPPLNGLPISPWLWGVTWTLKLEFLFYLLIPFLGWFAGTLQKSLLFVGGCGVLFALNHLVHAEHLNVPGLFLVDGLIRYLLFAFSVGIVSAHLVRIRRVRDFGRSLWAAPISVTLIAITLYLVPARYGPVESLCLAVPFLAVACGCSFWGALRSRAIVFLGQISYSVYLIHNLVYGAILMPLHHVEGSLASPQRYWMLVFLIAPVIIGVATLWHRTFELPFLMKKSIFVQPPVLSESCLPALQPNAGI